jgi:predicted DNA-binding protein with PD1-like motif
MKAKILMLIAIVSFATLRQAQASDSGTTTTDSSASSTSTFVNHRLPDAIEDELTPAQVKIFGDSPNVSYRVVNDKEPRSFLITLGKNDDVISALYKFAEANQIKGASFTGIGAVGCAALGFFDKDKRAYKVNKLPQQSELSSLSGNIACKDTGYVVHAHAVVSVPNGICLGGHLLYASAWPTVEIMLTETAVKIEKHPDAETGLSLYGQSDGTESK